MLEPLTRSAPELYTHVPTPQNLQERLELANRLYQEYRVQCFWHSPRDLDITEDQIPFVMKGLRANGGHRGFLLASRLAPNPSDPLKSASLFRAEASRGEDRAKLDCTTDSAFQFFPVQQDDEGGYCLHRADQATNTMLAIAGRSSIRDFLDILQLDQEYLSLGMICWAACGKNTGFTPDLLLQMTNRHSRYQEEDLRDQVLARPVDLRQLKRQWIAARERAESLAERLPPEELGCLYLNQANEPVTPDPDSPEFPGLRRHFGRVGGAWPRIS